MTTIYLTGTRNPGAALKRFLPDYIDILVQQGDQLVTSNKRGVDELVIHHCNEQKLPLLVCEFASDSGSYNNRHVKVTSETIQVQRVISPTWLRFRYLADTVDKMIFFHATTRRGRCYGLSTAEAFELACQRRGIEGEQLIVQQQEKIWTAVQVLRNAPTIGAVHIYVYARCLPGFDDSRHCIAHFRIESWRRMGQIIQPGIGRRELVVPDASREQATLNALHHALLELQVSPTQRIVIHHASHQLEALPYSNSREYSDLRIQVRGLLSQYPQLIWRREDQATVRQAIGKPISQAQELWNHRKPAKAYKGLYQ
jgi:hypothetical protein